MPKSSESQRMLGKRQIVIGLLGPWLLLISLSCHKKPAATGMNLPGPAQAPTLTQTLPYEIQPEQVPLPPLQTVQVEEPQDKPKQKPKTRGRARKNLPQAATTENATNQAPAPPGPSSGTETTSAAARPPGNPADAAAEVAIGPYVSTTEANRDRQSTTQMLDSTENELKRLESRNLSSEQQGTLMQIKTYISQSRKAITDGDYERASNLAKKAQLLTDELIKK